MDRELHKPPVSGLGRMARRFETSMWFGLSGGGVALLQLASTPVLARRMETGEFAASLVFLATLAVMIQIDGGLRLSILRTNGRALTRHAELRLSRPLHLRYLAWLLVTSAIALLAVPMFSAGESSVPLIVGFGALTAFGQGVGQIATLAFQTLGLYRLPGLVSLIGTVGATVVMATTSAGVDAKNFMILTASSYAAMAATTWLALLARARGRWAAERSRPIGEQLRFGLATQGTALTGLAQGQVDILIGGLLLTHAQLAPIAAAVPLAALLRTLPTFALAPLQREILLRGGGKGSASADHDLISRRWKRRAWLYTGGSLLVAAAAGPVLYPAEALLTAVAAMTFVLGGHFFIWSSVDSLILLGRDRAGEEAACNIAGLMVNVAGKWPLAVAAGPLGLPVSTAMGGITRGLLLAWRARCAT